MKTYPDNRLPDIQCNTNTNVSYLVVKRYILLLDNQTSYSLLPVPRGEFVSKLWSSCLPTRKVLWISWYELYFTKPRPPPPRPSLPLTSSRVQDLNRGNQPHHEDVLAQMKTYHLTIDFRIYSFPRVLIHYNSFCWYPFILDHQGWEMFSYSCIPSSPLASFFFFS